MVQALDQPDADVIVATTDLVGRSGATGFQIGHTDPDAGPVTWYCTAEYGPAPSITVSGHPGPVEAAVAMALRLLSGAKCRCGGLVALSVDGAWAAGSEAVMIDGSDPRELHDAEQCLWILEGQRWEPSCDAPSMPRPDLDELARRLSAE